MRRRHGHTILEMGDAAKEHAIRSLDKACPALAEGLGMTQWAHQVLPLISESAAPLLPSPAMSEVEWLPWCSNSGDLYRKDLKFGTLKGECQTSGKRKVYHASRVVHQVMKDNIPSAFSAPLRCNPLKFYA